MKLDLSEIAHSLGMHYTYEVDDDLAELPQPGISLDAPVRGKLEFSNTGQLLLVRGGLDTRVLLECVRCLTQFTAEQRVEIEEQFPLHPEAHYGEPVEDEGEELSPGDQEMVDILYDEGMLDLSEMIRQNLVVSLPLAPLCREDCPGLCPHCGKNLNEGACDCQDTDEPNPFGVLKELLEPGSEDRAGRAGKG